MKKKRIKKVSGGLTANVGEGTEVKGTTSYVDQTQRSYNQESQEEREVKIRKTRFGFF